MKVNRLLYKVHRIISWVLVPFMIIVVVSGYAYIRKIRILNRGLAYDLHNTFDLPLLLLLVAHVVLGARYELMRFKIKGRAVDAVLLLLGVVMGLALIIVELQRPR